MFQSEPAAVLSSIFPGPVRLRLSQDGQLFLPLSQPEGRGRVYEQLWLSHELFGVAEDEPVFATTEELCRAQGRDVGGQGEQLVLHSVQLDLLKAGSRFVLGDAIVECIGQWDLRRSSEGSAAESFPVIGFWLVEEGLVEPGVPLIGV